MANSKKPILVVMAAGMGSRFGGLKQIEAVGPRGEAILDYSLYDARRAGFETVVFIIKHAIEDAFKASVGARAERAGFAVRYAYQELDLLPQGYAVPEGRAKPWGTAHAILSAADVLEEFAPLFPGRLHPRPPLPEKEAQSRLEVVPEPPKAEKTEEKEVDKGPQRAYISLSDDPEAFTDDERDLLLALQRRILTADDLSEAAQIPARRVLSALTMLQIRGMVEERPGKRYAACVILTS